MLVRGDADGVVFADDAVVLAGDAVVLADGGEVLADDGVILPDDERLLFGCVFTFGRALRPALHCLTPLLAPAKSIVEPAPIKNPPTAFKIIAFVGSSSWAASTVVAAPPATARTPSTIAPTGGRNTASRAPTAKPAIPAMIGKIIPQMLGFLGSSIGSI